MRLAAAVFALAVALACASGDVSSDEPMSPLPEPTEALMVETDLAALQTRLRLPEGATSARFALGPLGKPGGLGPTDYNLVAFVAIDPERWGSVEAAYGTPRKPRGPTTIPEELARDLLPEEVRASLPTAGGGAAFEGEVYVDDTIGISPFRATQAVRVGDAGLYITAITM